MIENCLKNIRYYYSGADMAGQTRLDSSEIGLNAVSCLPKSSPDFLPAIDFRNGEQSSKNR